MKGRYNGGSIDFGTLMIFEGDTVIDGSVGPMSGIIVRNGDLTINGDVEYRSMIRIPSGIIVENGDLHIKGNVLKGVLVASGKVTVDGQCTQAVIECDQSNIKNSNDCNINRDGEDKPCNPKDDKLKRPAFPFSDLQKKAAYHFRHHSDSFVDYLTKISDYIARQREKLLWQIENSKASLGDHKSERKEPNSHSIIQNAISQAAEKKLTPEEVFLKNCSKYTKQYLESFAGKKSHSDIVSEMKLTKEEETLLEAAECCDPITIEVMDKPVLVNEVVYDFKNVLDFKGGKDPIKNVEFEPGSVSPYRKAVSDFDKVIKSITEARKKAEEAAKQKIISGAPGGPSFEDEVDAAPVPAGLRI